MAMQAAMEQQELDELNADEAVEYQTIPIELAKVYGGYADPSDAAIQSYSASLPLFKPWAPEEHTRFIDALRKLANCPIHLLQNEWPNVAEQVGTRSVTEVKVHAKVFFTKRRQKMAAMSAPTGFDASASSGVQGAPGAAFFGAGQPLRGGGLAPGIPKHERISPAESPRMTGHGGHLGFAAGRPLGLEDIAFEGGMPVAVDEGVPPPASEWSVDEQSVLEDGLRKYASERYSNVTRYLKIARMLPQKSVRDVALRVKWMAERIRAAAAAPPQAPANLGFEAAAAGPALGALPVRLGRRASADAASGLPPVPLNMLGGGGLGGGGLGGPVKAGSWHVAGPASVPEALASAAPVPGPKRRKSFSLPDSGGSGGGLPPLPPFGGGVEGGVPGVGPDGLLGPVGGLSRKAPTPPARRPLPADLFLPARPAPAPSPPAPFGFAAPGGWGVPTGPTTAAELQASLEGDEGRANELLDENMGVFAVVRQQLDAGDFAAAGPMLAHVRGNLALAQHWVAAMPGSTNLPPLGLDMLPLPGGFQTGL